MQRFRAIRTDLVLKLRDDFRFFNSNEVSELRSENEQLKQLVAELSLKNRVLKKKFEWFGIEIGRYMRYSQAEKMEIIRLVEASTLSVKKTFMELGVSRSTFYEGVFHIRIRYGTE